MMRSSRAPLTRLCGKGSFPHTLSGSKIVQNVGCVTSQQVSYRASLTQTTRSFASQPNKSNNNNDTLIRSGNRLAGRKCMITGGASGIGFAIAERFIQEGASTIVLVGRSEARLETAASKLGSIAGTLSGIDESNDEIATRTPEEDIQQDTQRKVRLLVGDVSNAGSWMRELEKEMVSYPIYQTK